MSARPPSSGPLKWTTSPCTSKAFASMMLSASFRMSSWPGWSVCGSRPGWQLTLSLRPPVQTVTVPSAFTPAKIPYEAGGAVSFSTSSFSAPICSFAWVRVRAEPLVLPLGLLELLPALLQARPQQLELPRHLLEPAADLVQLLLEPLHLGLEGVDLGVGFFGASGRRTLALRKLT